MQTMRGQSVLFYIWICIYGKSNTCTEHYIYRTTTDAIRECPGRQSCLDFTRNRSAKTDMAASWLLFYGHGTIFLTFAYGLINHYHFIDKSKSWSEAQQYCREHFTDLATIEREEDLSRVHIPAGQVAWIGLHDDPAAWLKVMTNASNSWRWSVTEATSPGGFQNWKSGNPDNGDGKEACVVLEGSKWKDYNCTDNALCLCFEVQSGVKQFFLFDDLSRTWLACQSVCRQQYQDLAQIESAAENQAATTALSGVPHAWIGLYRNIWLWSDLSNSSFMNWIPGSPNNMNITEHCVHMNEDGQMEDDTCSEPHKFVCHEALTPRSVARITLKLQSSADLTDPNIQKLFLKALEEKLGMNVTIKGIRKAVTKQP